MGLVKDSSTFLEIAQNLEHLNQAIIENGGEISDEQEQQLILVESMLTQKTQGIVDFLEMSDVYFQNLDSKIKELQEKKKVETNKIENLKKHIVHVMNAKEIKKLVTPDGLTEIKLRKPAKKVVVTDENLIPADFVSTETIVKNKVDLKSIKPHLENGDEVPGAKLENGKQSLMIKTKAIKDK